MFLHNNEPLYLLRQPSPHRMVIQYHPSIGHIYVPNLNARIPNELGGYYVKTNAEGFRSEIDFKRERGNRPRILFFGDSVTAGDGVSNRQRFSDLIGTELDVEVYNYGLSGSGTDQQLLIYEQFARDVEADLIVFGVMVENINRIQVSHRQTMERATGKLVNVPKPYFKLNNGRLDLYHSPVPKIRPEINHQQSEKKETKIDSGTNRLLHNLRLADNDSKINNLLGHWPNLRPKILQLTRYQPYPDYLSEDSQGWRLMDAILRRFISQASPTPILIVPIPRDYFYRDIPLEPLYQERFESLSDPTANVHVVDITTSLREMSSGEKAKLQFKHDFHFSPYGNQRVAEFITNEIRERNLLPETSQENKPVVISTNGANQDSGRDSYILGISCFYHNSAASLIKNGEIVAAAEEERFTRIKHDRNFPHRAINYCLEEAGILQSDLTAIVYYDNAYQPFDRLMNTQLAIGSAGEEAWLRVLPTWLQYKLFIPQLIRRNLKYDGPILQENHHRSHAASAFFPSPYERAAILTIDGVGEWATASICVGDGNKIEMIKEMHFPNSVGLLYSAFTQFVGFKVNNGEYKMMGLAPYGEPTYVDLIREHLVDIKEDGSIELNMEYFAFLSEPTMTNQKFTELFGGPARHPDDPVTRREMDIARSIQVVTEEIILRMAQHAFDLTGEKYLCLAGGVALNCVANGRLLREGPFADIWIQPAAGDAGCALGAALDVWHTYMSKPRSPFANGRSSQRGSYWGPEYSDAEIKAFLETYGYPYQAMMKEERAARVASFIEDGKVVGHFTGRLEYGPRALGSRSILGDARSQEMQTTINLKIKYRESFRPFAPTVLSESIQEYFDLDRESPYMLLVAPVQEDRLLPFERNEDMSLFDIVKQPRSDVPAITHVNYSARVQSINRQDHAPYYDVIKAFQTRTGYGVIVNTSFNVRGEPIVCSPYDAYRCFMRTEMDVLILGDYLLFKEEQPAWPEEKGHIEKYDPDAISNIGDDPATAALLEIFESDFLPVSSRYQQSNGHSILSSESRPTTWVECSPDQTGDAIFVIPLELSASELNPELMTKAMLQYWQKNEVRDALIPVVAKLLSLGIEQWPIDEEKEVVEEVPDFTYVMY